MKECVTNEWSTLVEQFSRVTDGLGKHIDQKILETVVALNALGIPTVQSCGGHFGPKRGLLLPWVDIESTDPSLASLQQEEYSLVETVSQAHQQVTTIQTMQASEQQLAQALQHLEEVCGQKSAVQFQIRLLQAKPRQQLALLLSQFYTDHQAPFDCRLVLEGKNRTRLHNQGAVDLYLTSSAEIQQQKLLEYQKELAAFTSFLKQIYFSRQTAHA